MIDYWLIIERMVVIIAIGAGIWFGFKKFIAKKEPEEIVKEDKD